MPDRSPELNAAMRAVRGESDLDAIMPALADAGPARVIACAPETHHLVRAIAALRGGLTTLLAPEDIASPALHDALARLIGTTVGNHVLTAWAEIAPVGWGRSHAEALRDAVQRRRCAPSAAAVLIGPCDAGARLLTNASDIALVIRRWGQSPHAGPTAWASVLSDEERSRLITVIWRDSFSAASCLPWLPPDAVRTADDDAPVGDALDAFAAASPTARTLHADRIRQLVADARPERLAALTRLACAMQTNEVWTRVQMLIRESPDDAWSVVVAAPWDDLADDVRDVILACADSSDVCAAVAAARGRRDAAMTNITAETSAAFFAALDPAVWDALDPATQQRWLQELWGGEANLAVRSLGLRPEVLARAAIHNHLVRAAQRHARDAAVLRSALLPVALRRLPPAAAYAVIASLPTPPPDPGAFFIIAGGRADPDVRAPARAALRSPADLALAVVLQRSGEGGASIRACCAALQHALRGRSYDDLAPILALLSAAARAALLPDTAALARRLAHPYRLDTLRQALDRLAALPPAVAIPTSIALTCWTPWNAADASAAGADALRAHGDVFLTLTDALAHTEALMHDDLRQALLPLPEDAALADALRALARDDPLVAQRLAYGLRDRSWRDALEPLLDASQPHANAVWNALDDAMRRGIASVLAAELLDANPLAVHDPIAALALAAVHVGDDDLRTAGVAALSARPGIVRAIWEQLPLAVQRKLGDLPAFADLMQPLTRSAIRHGRRGSRLS